MKTCSRCKIEKSFDAFGKNKSRKDGYQHRCKSCCSCDQKKYRENNPELKRENNKIYYAINKQSGL